MAIQPDFPAKKNNLFSGSSIGEIKVRVNSVISSTPRFSPSLHGFYWHF
jgi:hypothetical protein